jgi:hypothetical protein
MLPALQRLVRPPAEIPPPGPLKKSTGVNTCESNGPAGDCKVYALGAGDVLTYSSDIKKKLIEPQGTIVDPSGNWYIANTGANDVPIYNSAGTKMTSVLDDTGQDPVDVAVAPNLVAVSNIYSETFGSGSVSLYAGGATSPTSTLSSGTDFAQGVGVAIDPSGNCYWAYNDLSSGLGYVVEWTGCTGSPTTIVDGTILYVGGITFDKAGNLYYTDQGVETIYKCTGTTNCVSWSTGYGDPLLMHFDAAGKVLWVADSSGYIDAVNPKNGKIIKQNVATGGKSLPPLGVAPVPGAAI